MENCIVFILVALAFGYVIRRFFFRKETTCGCGCQGCGVPRGDSAPGDGACRSQGDRPGASDRAPAPAATDAPCRSTSRPG